MVPTPPEKNVDYTAERYAMFGAIEDLVAERAAVVGQIIAAWGGTRSGEKSSHWSWTGSIASMLTV